MLVSCHTLWHSTYSGDFVGSCVSTDMYMIQMGTVCVHESKVCHVLEWMHVHMFNACAYMRVRMHMCVYGVVCICMHVLSFLMSSIQCALV